MSACDAKRALTQQPLAGVEDHNANAHGFCTSTKNSANFNLVNDRQEPMSIVDSAGEPKMSFGHVANVDAAMPKRYRMLAVIGILANEFDRVARPDLFVDIATTINSLRRFAFELCYPRWIRLHAAFCKQGQRVCSPLPLSGLS